MAQLRQRLEQTLAGRFVIERELGRGGMSVVFLARDLKLERLVALKVLREELSAALGPERFHREIKLAARLSHPHILKLHDSGDAVGLLYYVMPYVSGESLRDRLEREKRLPADDAVQIAREVAAALDYAHRENVVHRDIKPENILFEAGYAIVSDFGVARAISAAGGDRVTAFGIAVGTPDYMSPEQAGGEEQVDGRSDVYGLGCVLYEMLSGRTPFTGSTPQDVMVGQVYGTVAPLAEARPELPPALVQAVERALAKDPRDRFQTAGDFEAALAAVVGAVGRRPRRVPARWWAGLAGAAALGGVAVAVLPRLLGAGLDPSLYVVVPFGHRGGAAPGLIDGDRCERLLSEAFARWEDIRVSTSLSVHDRLMRRGDPELTLGTALALARDLGAGTLVWGTVGQTGDTIDVEAALYEVRRGRPRHTHTARLPANLEEVRARFVELADSLLFGGARAKGSASAATGTSLVSAWQDYDEGRAALDTWDLEGAKRALRLALARDRDYRHANLWLAQVLMWSGAPAADWRIHAEAAADGVGRLGRRDRDLARALAALGNGSFPDACAAFHRLAVRDPRDFAAWYGLGDCRARDRLVVRDGSSPSGWAFRGSWHAAVTAYQRALEVAPSAHRAFGGAAQARLARLFFTEANTFRPGFALAPDTTRFAAWPGLDHDTLAFVPYPAAAFFSNAPGVDPPTNAQALARNRARVREVTETWAREFPESAVALDAHARVLELLGEPSALDVTRAARRAARDSLQALRLAAAEVRLLVKLERLEAARRLADSILAAWPRADAPAAWWLTGLAALRGRVYRAAALAHTAGALDTLITVDGEPIATPPALTGEASALLAYAAFGAPAESLEAVERRVRASVASWIEPRRQGVVLHAALHQPAMLTYFERGAQQAHRGPLGGNLALELQAALARGDTGRVRARLARMWDALENIRPGDVSIEVTAQEVRILLALGDTAAATEHLDRSLGALPTLGTSLLEHVPQAPALVRAMALRADLADRAGDRAAAARWGRAVAILWDGADAPLDALVARMRALVARGGR